MREGERERDERGERDERDETEMRQRSNLFVAF
jgi:hypothetical protein